MEEALRLAELSKTLGEVPVGAVVVKENQIVGRGFNMREINTCALEHAEVNAIRDAAKNLGRWRLNDCEIYSTLEPCFMCAGAIFHARIMHLVYGADDVKFGAIESLYRLGEDQRLNHQFSHESGMLADESKNLLQEFFTDLRAKKSPAKK